MEGSWIIRTIKRWWIDLIVKMKLHLGEYSQPSTVLSHQHSDHKQYCQTCLKLIMLLGSYHSSHFNLLSRALSQSIKICLQIESSGFLCIQIMMPIGEGVPMGGHSGILEFKVGCLKSLLSLLLIDVVVSDARAGGRRLVKACLIFASSISVSWFSRISCTYYTSTHWYIFSSRQHCESSQSCVSIALCNSWEYENMYNSGTTTSSSQTHPTYSWSRRVGR